MRSNSNTTKTELVSRSFKPAPNALKDLQAKIQMSKFAHAPVAGYSRVSSGRPLKMTSTPNLRVAAAPSKIKRSDLDK